MTSPGRAWRAAWAGEESPRGLVAARIIVALHTLWILASRPDLPEVLSWEAAFWRPVNPFAAQRFLILGLDPGVECWLYRVCGLLLATAALGLLPRASCFGAALLTYHFAPIEEILAPTGGPFFRGLTTNVLALFVLSFAEAPRWNLASSPEFRWPLTLIRLLFSANYLLAGIAKLQSAGLAWASAANFEALVMGLMLPEVVAPWAHVFVDSRWLCGLGGVGGLAMDFAVPVVVFSRRLAVPIVLLVALAHLLIVQIFGVVFLGAPLLLLYLDWGRVLSRRGAITREAIVA